MEGVVECVTSYCLQGVIRTFIMSSSVLNTISIMIKYSNGVETTIRQTLYLKLFRVLGM